MGATVVLACVAPTARDVDHSKNTLSYAAPLKVAVEAAPHLQRDDRDPALWATAQLIEWVSQTAPCTMEQAKQIVNQNTGVQFCAVSESALFAPARLPSSTRSNRRNCTVLCGPRLLTRKPAIGDRTARSSRRRTKLG